MNNSDAPLAQDNVDQAIEWLIRLRYNSPSAHAKQGFQRWLERHPQNALAWARVSAMSDEFGALPRELSRNTLEGTQRRRISRRDSLKLLGILTVASGLGWAGRDQLGLPMLVADKHTATGERRTYRTDDGSQIQLNTASAIDLSFDETLRALSLIQGEVAIQTGDDPRPFRITTRDGVLQTQGSRLLVRQREEGTLLAVRQGTVTLYAGNGSTSQIAHPGDQLLFTSTGQIRPAISHGDPWGWSEGVLSVQQMPLGEFIAELSRYRRGVLRCSDAVAGLKVFGTYQLSDTDQILSLVAKALPIRVDYRTRYWVNVSAV